MQAEKGWLEGWLLLHCSRPCSKGMALHAENQVCAARERAACGPLPHPSQSRGGFSRFHCKL